MILHISISIYTCRTIRTWVYKQARRPSISAEGHCILGVPFSIEILFWVCLLVVDGWTSVPRKVQFNGLISPLKRTKWMNSGHGYEDACEEGRKDDLISYLSSYLLHSGVLCILLYLVFYCNTLGFFFLVGSFVVYSI